MKELKEKTNKREQGCKVYLKIKEKVHAEEYEQPEERMGIAICEIHSHPYRMGWCPG